MIVKSELIKLKNFSELRKMNYSKLCKIKPNSEISYYLVLRASIILGKFREALSIFNEANKKKILSKNTTLLIQLQLTLYRDRDFTKTSEFIKTLSQKEIKDSFLSGELNFIIGYFYSLQDLNQAAIIHFHIAHNKYHTLNLNGHSAISIFNAAVCSNHLGETASFHKSLKDLEGLSTSFPEIIAIKQVYLRLRVYANLDEENYEKAKEHLAEAICLYKKDERLSDMAAMTCNMGYLLLKKNNLYEFTHISFPHEVKSIHRKVFMALTEISKIGLLNPTQPLQLIKKWKSELLPSVHMLFLIDLICEKIIKISDPVLLKKVSILGQRLSLEKQQVLKLVDLRYYEIYARIQLNELKKAHMLLNQYQTESNSDAKLMKIQFLWNLIRERKDTLFEDHLYTLEFSLLTKKMIINHKLLLKRERPILYKAFISLLDDQRGLELHQLFEKVYGSEFHSESHLNRLNALVVRMKSYLPASHLIIRKNKRITLSPLIKIKNIDLSLSKEERLLKIEKFIEASKAPLSMANIEGHFNCSRRTIQLDLKDLIHQGSIRTTGSTKGRRYMRTQHA